jgi:hypothetical protein
MVARAMAVAVASQAMEAMEAASRLWQTVRVWSILIQIEGVGRGR